MLRKAALQTAPALALVLSTACSDTGREVSATASQPTGITTAPATDPSGATTDAPPTGTSTDTGEPTSTTSTTTTSTTSPASDTNQAKFDLGASDLGGGTTGTAEKGCKKVDFLFVIDNSTSMENNQAALIQSFPGFIDAIKNTLVDVTDYHIMVVDTDANGRCPQPCDEADPDYVKFCSAANYYACSAMLEPCDTTLGAGMLHPVGSFASNKPCPVAGGNRYMLPNQPDLEGTFACVAQVGTAGSPAEKPMNAMQAAIGEALNFPMGCNGGFIRDDAILVVTFISDDPNYVDKGTPAEWKASVVEAKNGDENAAVILGLIPHPELGCITGNDPNLTQGSHWQEFIEMWDKHGVSGSVCEADYAPFFLQAVNAIDQTCDDFNPPG
ncbi:hypothetical protein [Nannocystis pusilla]|uniref:hypothetical protein n=1 Tax=Nannocystis pusilla TaxID=889268 RepID=UPI003BEFAF6E